MGQNNVSDWRNELYDGRLNGITFEYKKFSSTKTNDHEHCIFCWQKITDLKLEGVDSEGYRAIYSKTGQEEWVCKQCFQDFKNLYDFKLK